MQHQHAAAQLQHVAKFGTHWSAARWCEMKMKIDFCSRVLPCLTFFKKLLMHAKQRSQSKTHATPACCSSTPTCGQVWDSLECCKVVQNGQDCLRWLFSKFCHVFATRSKFFLRFFFLPLDQAHLGLSQTALKIVEQAFIRKLRKFGLKGQDQCLSSWLTSLFSIGLHVN